MLASNQIAFSDDQLPLKGNEHILAMHIVVKSEGIIVTSILIDNGSAFCVFLMAMHIIVKCEGMIVTRILIDNGSTSNVFPMATLGQLKVDVSLIWSSAMIIRAFDGTH